MVPNTIRFESDAFANGPHQRTADDDEAPYWGGDVAAWLSARLAVEGWMCEHRQEDWGWCVAATAGERRYIFGVYWEPPGANPPPDDGVGLWCIRLFNQRDPRWWWARLTARTRAPVEEDVMEQVRRWWRRRWKGEACERRWRVEAWPRRLAVSGGARPARRGGRPVGERCALSGGGVGGCGGGSV